MGAMSLLNVGPVAAMAGNVAKSRKMIGLTRIRLLDGAADGRRLTADRLSSRNRVQRFAQIMFGCGGAAAAQIRVKIIDATPVKHVFIRAENNRLRHDRGSGGFN